MYHPTPLNPVHPLGSSIANEAKGNQTKCDAGEPGQVPFILLPGNPHVHAPEAGDDVHGQDDGTEHGQLVEAVGRLLRALRHLAVNMGEIVGVGSREDPVVPSVIS